MDTEMPERGNGVASRTEMRDVDRVLLWAPRYRVASRRRRGRLISAATPESIA